MNSVAPTPIDTSTPVPARRSIRFPARSFLAFALAPEAPLSDWLDRLDHWLQNSPGFFAGRPVVLDLGHLPNETRDIRALVEELGARGIRVYAIESTGIEFLPPDLPPLLKGARKTETEVEEERQAAESAPVEVVPEGPAPSTTLTIDAPIRSGQSVYHPHGDVVVLGSVGSGSEIVAGGSIHVYGTLRGRAIAGAIGNGAARIFCSRNEAELLAIDGWYSTAEDMPPQSRGKPAQAFLANEQIHVAALN